MATESAPGRNPGGRPTIGPPAKWALPAALRTELDAARRPGESEAAAARRLLAAALNPDPAIPAIMRQAADIISASDPAAPEFAEHASVAAELRQLAAALEAARPAERFTT